MASVFPERSAPGFTLVELVVVIVLVGIIGLVGANLIGDFVGGYVDATQRQELSSSGRIAVERSTRELRRALPNSVLCPSSPCTELAFLRTSNGGRYQAVGPASSRLQINQDGDTFVAFGLEDLGTANQLAVYPQDGDHLFGDAASNTNRRARIDSRNKLGSGDEVRHQITLNGSDSFPHHSPQRRLYGIENVVSLCCSGNRLLLGIHSLSQVLDANPGTFCGRSGETHTLAENVTQCRFTYEPATLTRSAIVRLFLKMQSPDSGEAISFQQEVQVRNVP